MIDQCIARIEAERVAAKSRGGLGDLVKIKELVFSLTGKRASLEDALAVQKLIRGL
jgi:hypothetical protein